MAGWERLRQLRESKELSRAALAAKAGTTETQIYRLETGAWGPERASYGMVRALADALGVQIADLMEQTDDIDAFVRRIEQMDNGTRSILANHAGGHFADADARTLRVFYSALPSSVSDEDAGLWYEAGCIIAGGLRRERDNKWPQKVLAEAIARISKANDAWYIVKRAIHALDGQWAPDSRVPDAVNKLVRLATQENYRIDYRALLSDVLRWNDENRPVAREWATYLVDGAKQPR